MRRARLLAGTAQAILLVPFRGARFFGGCTGLTGTVGAIVTRSLVMQMTATARWAEFFATQTVTDAGAR